jgi:signal transduction histidine kinase
LDVRAWTRIWAPSEPLGSRRRRSWAFDGAVVVFALLVSSTYAFNAVPSVSATVAGVLVLIMVLPLLVRRVWPVPVFAWCLLVAAVAGWWALQVVWSPALVIALYTVAALRPRREALAAAGVLALAVLAASVRAVPHDWPVTATTLLAVVATATVLGLYVGTRRVLLDQLRERAERLERERDQQGELAAAAERARIAREMHDIVAHHLTVMVTLADGAAAQSALAPDAAAAAMRTVSATGRLALSDTRRLLGVLREPDPGEAARSPLPTLVELDELVERVRGAGLPVRYEIEGTPPAIAPGVQLTLYRLVQEALTNTMKHAGPGASAVVRVRYAHGEVGVDIEDDGHGPGDGTPGSGRGLAGMRERVHAFGGEVRSGPRTPRGWAVSARLRIEEVDRS